MAPRIHDNFREIKIHTAKCDTCNKHNKLTIYRCTTCGFQQCTPCWNSNGGDTQHEFVLPGSTIQTAPAAAAVNTSPLPVTEEQEEKSDNEAQQVVAQEKKRKADVLSEPDVADVDSLEEQDQLNTDGVVLSDENNASQELGGVRKKRRFATPPIDSGDIGLPSLQTYHSVNAGDGLPSLASPSAPSKAGSNSSLSNPVQSPLQIRQPNDVLMAASSLLEIAKESASSSSSSDPIELPGSPCQNTTSNQAIDLAIHEAQIIREAQEVQISQTSQEAGQEFQTKGLTDQKALNDNIGANKAGEAANSSVSDTGVTEVADFDNNGVEITNGAFGKPEEEAVSLPSDLIRTEEALEEPLFQQKANGELPKIRNIMRVRNVQY